MKKHTLYVGANNETSEVEKDVIVQTTARHFEGFTMSDNVGYWEGRPEGSVSVIVFTEDTGKVYQLANELKEKCKQEAVIVEDFAGNGVLV
jgi:hypothetical protein